MIKFGLYDAFSYTIPGGFYLATFLYMGVVFGAVTIDFATLNDLVLTQIIVLAILAYVMGLLFDPLARKWHFGVFERDSSAVSKKELEEINAISHLKIKPERANWPILVSFIRNQQYGDSDSFERFNATNIMLRNISLSLFLAGIATIVLVFQTHFYIWNIILAVGLFIFSILAGTQASRFRKWYYQGIYQNIIAYASKPTDFVTEQHQPKEKQKNGDKGNG